MAGAVINDHIQMVTPNGKYKQVPIWQIKQWIAAGKFEPNRAKGNDIGYDFVNQKQAIADLQAFEANENRKRLGKKAGAGIPVAVDQGIAEVQFARKPVEQTAFSTPPIPNVGEETIGKPGPKKEPEDVI